MIARYSRAEMASLWSTEKRYAVWLQVELAGLEAMSAAGLIPSHVAPSIRAKARIDPKRIAAIEEETKHDVAAFVDAVAETVGPDGRFLHLGLTSSDILDTALAVILKEACDLLAADLKRLLRVLHDLAQKHRETMMIGRSHGMHAEPITFGLKIAAWYDETRRGAARLARAREEISVGKLSGAMGTFAHLPSVVEQGALSRLNLKPEPASTQIVPRDRHAYLLLTLALIAASLEKFATEIRHLQRTEVQEVEEPFGEEQKGSSSMPHKRNPVGCENLCGLARVVRANATAALENVALWHERDISHSSVERIILPDSTILLDFMIDRLVRILEGLRVYPERMRANLEATHGVIYSQKVLLALLRKGMSRSEAYRIVQRRAMETFSQGRTFFDLLAADPDLLPWLSKEELAACFNPRAYVAESETIYRRVFG